MPDLTSPKSARGRSAGRVRGFLAALRTLTMMQLKEKMDLSWTRSKRRSLFKIVWLLAEFVGVTALCYLLIYAVKLLGVFSLVGDFPDTVMTVVFTFMTGLSLVFGTAGLVRSLYFSRDNMVLLTLPATPSVVFLSKLAVYYIYEFRKNFMFMIPLFLAYGISKNYPLYFYPWLVLMFVFISAVPVILSALLSIPGMFVYQWIRKIKAIQYALYVILAAGAAVAVLYAISLIPANIDLQAEWGTIFWKIQDFLGEFCRVFSVMYAFIQLVFGRSSLLSVSLFTKNTLPHLLILIGGTAALAALCLLLAKPLFYKMASKPFEYTKKANPKAAKNKKRGGFATALRRELICGLRSNSLITSAFLVVIVMPIAIHLLNRIYLAMNTRYLGNQMTVSFNILIILLILLSTNVSVASAYSRDGSAAYLNKIQPTAYEGLLIAKLVPSLVVGLVGTAATLLIYRLDTLNRTTMQPLPGAVSNLGMILIGITAYFFYVAHLFWSAEMDIMRPQYEQYATFSEQSNNPNENMSALLVFVLAFLAFLVSLLLAVKESAESAWLKLSVIAAAFAAVKIFTFLMKIKVFYKEKS